MTLAPDTADIAAPDPSDYGRSRKAAGAPRAVWGLMLFGMVCMGAGMGIAIYGARLLQGSRADLPAPVVSTAPLAPVVAPDPLLGAVPPPTSTAADVSALQSRLAALETLQARTADASAAALTAANLSAAAEQSRSFAAEAAAAERALPQSADVRALRVLSIQGAPSRAALQASFATPAARAVAARNDPGPGAGLPARLLRVLNSVVSIRRVDSTTGTGFDAVLARAERETAAGDIEGALKSLSALPPGSRAVFADWTEQAQRRAEVDRRVAAVRNTALADMALASRIQP